MQRKSELKAKKPLATKTSLKSNAKPKKQAKPKVNQLKKKLDGPGKNNGIFSKYIVRRDGVCITCGATNNLQSGHFQSRRHNNTRYDEQNCNAQCMSCNVWFHGEQYKYAKALDLKYGAGTAVRLEALAKIPHPFKVEELQALIEEYTA